ncbi:hypothetical protein [Catellatospora methionotrophica]|uniref:hypothetical protein n=1 Tax=Catellatospora methionotrophica TaxID=121620 RepID=UPI003411B531
MDEQPALPYRPQALATYQVGRPGEAAAQPIRASRRPLALLAALLLACVAFAAVVRVPQAVDGTVIGADGTNLVSMFPPRLDPAPGAEVTMLGEQGRVRLRVVRAEAVTDPAAAQRWGLPQQAALPVTVVVLAGHAGGAFGRLSLVVAEPTLLELIPELKKVTP